MLLCILRMIRRIINRKNKNIYLLMAYKNEIKAFPNKQLTEFIITRPCLTEMLREDLQAE